MVHVSENGELVKLKWSDGIGPNSWWGDSRQVMHADH